MPDYSSKLGRMFYSKLLSMSGVAQA